MMLVAKILHPERDDRFVQLSIGSHTIGSDISCDVVLLDEPFLGRHAILHVSETAVHVELCDEATAKFHHLGIEDPTILLPGVHAKWTSGDRLEIADVTLHLQGEQLTSSTEHDKQSGIPKARQLRRRVLLAVGSMLIATGVIALQIEIDFSIPRANASIEGQNTLQEMPHQPVQIERQALEAKLENLALQGDGLHLRDGIWHATFRARSLQDGASIRAGLAELKVPLKPKIYVDSQLLKAANLIMSIVETEAKAQNLQRGVLVVTGVKGEPAEKLRKHVLSDVPGIIDVKFEKALAIDPDGLRDKIAGIWSGRHPYVALQDNRLIRPGQELDKGITLHFVDETSISVVIDDEIHEVHF